MTASVGERAGERAREGVGGRRARQIGIYALLVVTFLVILFPLLYALSASFMTADEIGAYPPHFLPSAFDLANYETVLRRLPIPRFLLNSLIVSGGVMIGQLITASLAAYAFAVREFRGRTVLFACFLFTLMIPFEVTIIPNFQTVQGFGWTDTYVGLIGPFVATAFGTFLLRQFFLTIPKELHDAATIDGCGSLRYLLTIVLPLSRPALGTLAIYSFVQTWNQYLWPLLVTNHRDMRTIQIGLRFLQNEESISWNLVMAGVVLAVLPTVLLLIFGQRQLIRGLTAGAVKG
ncbi:MAG TPA: carbohydrate ABC transporter permease [Thermomicrobiales bacterium]|nr:carbohydrate ABC transporter permease [Thermomicrobiales bacterium]